MKRLSLLVILCALTIVPVAQAQTMFMNAFTKEPLPTNDGWFPFQGPHRTYLGDDNDLIRTDKIRGLARPAKIVHRRAARQLRLEGPPSALDLKKKTDLVLVACPQVIRIEHHTPGRQMPQHLFDHEPFPTRTNPRLTQEVIHIANLHRCM
jgi:hypothetical protein